MANIQYVRNVDWDSTLSDLGLNEDGYVIDGNKTTSGAPTATVNKFAAGCIIQNTNTGVLYVNSGSYASPVWSVIDASTGGLPALTNGRVWIGNASNVATAVALSGDVTTSNAGVTAIGAGKVLLAMLGAGIAPSHVVKFAGKHTTTGGSATEAFTVTGVASTDIVIATMQTAGGTPRTLLTSAPTTDTITLVFSGDPSTTHIVSYQVLRAAV